MVLTLDESEESTDAGMLALQAWCVDIDGPAAEKVNSQLFSLNAGLVALQASLSFVPDNSVVEKLKERMQLIEHAKSQCCDNVAAAGMHSKFDFHASLAAITQTVEKLRDEVSTKAGYEDTRIALSLIEIQVVKLVETTVEQSQLETILSSKIDRDDLNQIAALVASGNFDGINSSVASKLQPPKLRCLCCDKPLTRASLSMKTILQTLQSPCPNPAKEAVVVNSSSLKTKYLSAKPQNSTSRLSVETPDIIKLHGFAPEPPLPKSEVSRYPRLRPM